MSSGDGSDGSQHPVSPMHARMLANRHAASSFCEPDHCVPDVNTLYLLRQYLKTFL